MFLAIWALWRATPDVATRRSKWALNSPYVLDSKSHWISRTTSSICWVLLSMSNHLKDYYASISGVTISMRSIASDNTSNLSVYLSTILACLTWLEWRFDSEITERWYTSGHAPNVFKIRSTKETVLLCEYREGTRILLECFLKGIKRHSSRIVHMDMSAILPTWVDEIVFASI